MPLASAYTLSNQVYRDLTERDKTMVNISSLAPDAIIDQLRCARQKLVFMVQNDVWRYGDHHQLLTYFADHPDQIFIIQTIGYDYRKQNNVIEIPVPFMYNRLHEFPDHTPSKIKGYASLNVRPNLARLLLGYRLWENALIPRMIYTQQLKWHDIQYLGGYEKVLFEQLPRYQDYLDILPITLSDGGSDLSDLHSISNVGYLDACCQIVSETETEFFDPIQNVPIPCVTEKTIKPFLAKQIPVFLSAQGHLAYLEGLGLCVYRNLLPENFDGLGTFDKVDCIVNLVLQGDEYIRDQYDHYRKEIDHNCDWIRFGGFSQSVLGKIKDFLGLD